MAALKGSFYCSTVLFALCGVALAVGGVLYSNKLAQYTNLRSQVKFQFDYSLTWSQLTPWVFTSVGCFAVFVSLCGFLGAGFNNTCLLITHCILLTLAVCLTLGSAVTTILIATTENDRFINDTVTEVYRQSKIRHEVRTEFGELEKFLKCCGLVSYTEYLRDRLSSVIPRSCCDESDYVCMESLTIGNHRNGCLAVAVRYSSNWFKYGAYLSGGAAFLGVISLVLNIALTIALRRQSKSIS